MQCNMFFVWFFRLVLYNYNIICTKCHDTPCSHFTYNFCECQKPWARTPNCHLVATAEHEVAAIAVHLNSSLGRSKTCFYQLNLLSSFNSNSRDPLAPPPSPCLQQIWLTSQNALLDIFNSRDLKHGPRQKSDLRKEPWSMLRFL